jgi:hypothetical protein
MKKTGTPTVVPAIMRSFTKLIQKKEFAEGVPFDTLIRHVQVFEGQTITERNITSFMSREGRGFLRRNDSSVSLLEGVVPADLPELVSIAEGEAGRRRRGMVSRQVGQAHEYGRKRKEG